MLCSRADAAEQFVQRGYGEEQADRCSAAALLTLCHMPLLLTIMHELAEFSKSSTGNHCYDLIRKYHTIFLTIGCFAMLLSTGCC